jgi:hypothetical protein
MSTEKGAAIRGNAREGVYSGAWRLANDILKPQTYGELVKLYGEGLKFVDALFWAKRTIDVSTRSLRVIEEGHFWDTLTTSAQVNTQVTDGHNISVVSTNFVREGLSLHIPAQYFTGADIPQTYRIMTRSAGGSPWTYTCQPFLDISLDVAIPASTELIIGASSFAPGTQQIASSVQDYFDHSHTTRIIKETVNFEGGQSALQEWEDLKTSEYGANLRARAALITQMKMRLQQNDYVLMGVPITNHGGMTQHNRWNEDNNVLSDYGIIPAMSQATGAMKQYYTGSYAEDNFDVVKFLLASQGLAGNNSVFFGLGQELFTSIENNMLKFIREYSGGTQLYYDSLNKVGFNVREIYKNNTKFYLCEIPEFSDPVRYAAPDYNFETMGLIFPDTKVTATLNGFNPQTMANAAGEKRSLNHVTMGFLNYGGENRRMIMGNKAGVNGFGIPFSDDWDDSSTYCLSEMMVINLALNQTILVLRTDD